MIVSCGAYIYKKISRADLIHDWSSSIESALLASEWDRSESVGIRFSGEAVGPSITSHLTEIIRMQIHRIDDVAGIFTAFSPANPKIAGRKLAGQHEAISLWNPCHKERFDRFCWTSWNAFQEWGHLISISMRFDFIYTYSYKIFYLFLILRE